MKIKSIMPFVLATFVIVGCTQKEEVKEVETDIHNEQPTLTVWTDIGGKDALESSIESYQAQYGYHVEIKEIDPKKQRIKLEEAKNKPDIIVLPHTEIGLAAKQELINPIDISSETKESFYKAALDTMKFDGKLYGLPKNVNLPVFIYNTDALEKAPETFDELKEFVQSSKTEEITPFAFEWSKFKESSFIFNTFDGKLFEMKENGYNVDKNLLSANENIKALQYLNTLFDEGVLPEKDIDILDGLKKGTILSAIISLDDYFKLKDDHPNLVIDIIPKIKDDKENIVYVETMGWFITKESENKELAQKFIEHITSLDNSSFRSETTNEIVPIKNLLNKEGILEEESMEEEVLEEEAQLLSDGNEEELKESENEENLENKKTFRQVVMEQLEHAKAYPNIPHMKDVLPQMDTAIRLTTEDVLDEKTALEYASKELSILIKANY